MTIDSKSQRVVMVGLAAVAALAMILVSDTADDKDVGAGPANPVAKAISTSQDLIEGPMSRGRTGDYLLANNNIQVVIQQPQRNLLNVGQFGGQIIDADLVRQGSDPERDSFEEMAFGINAENTAHYTTVTIVNDGSNGQPAVIRASGVDDLLDFINPSSQVAGFGFGFPSGFDDVDLPVTITTDYILAANSDFVQMETTVTNTHPTDEVDTVFTEFIGASGQLEQFVAGYGFGEPLITAPCTRCDFIGWAGYGDAAGVSYGYVFPIPGSAMFSTSGVTIPLLGTDAVPVLIGGQTNQNIPANGGQVTVTRYFAVGDGDIGSIVDIRNQILGLATGTIQGTVTRDGLTVEGADVVVLNTNTTPPVGPGATKNVVSHYRTDINGQYQGTLPPGNYNVQANLDGHLAASPDPALVTITASMTTVQDFTVPAAGRVRVTIVDESSVPIAAKVSLVGFDPYPDPENFQLLLGSVEARTGIFGEVYFDRLPYGVSQVHFVGASGDSGEFFVEPGSYRVVVSHGTEYSIYQQDITITAGALTTVNAQVARVIDTTGFISGDFHVHQLDSPDSVITYAERLVSMIAEGVDFFTPSDHEHRSDLSPTITALGIGSLISVAPNNENTTADYGHFNAWPLAIDFGLPNGGAVDWGRAAPAGQDFPSYGNYGLSPAEIFAALLADPGTDTVQINHIDSFFDAGGLAIDTALVPPQDFANNATKRLDPSISNLWDDSFTALEIYQGTDRSHIDRFVRENLGDWSNLMNQGIVRPGLADSDTHKRIIDQAGFPRTMIASPTDSPGSLGAIAETLATNENAGRSIGTNSPFVRVTTSAASTGQTGGLALGEPTLISTTNGAATVTVDIESPLWAEFDLVEYYINSATYPDDVDGNPATPPRYRAGPDVVQVKDVDFTVTTVNDFPLIPGAQHLEATATLNLAGLTQDTWVVVIVRGRDGVSRPLFPVVPNDLRQSSNQTLAALTDGNLGEDGVLALAFTNPVFIDVNGNSVYDPPGVDITPTVDTDQDGCANAREQGANASKGGRRNYLSFWDFYDTPNSSNVRDKVVTVGGDIFQVARRFGANDANGTATPNRNSDPLAGPIPAIPGYHPAFDRGPLNGPNPWNMTAPDGTISVGVDILGVARQFAHSCL
jgi:hypothetical protein